MQLCMGIQNTAKIKTGRMKAIVYKKYGPPEVMRLMEVDKPVPKENEVLIKIHATTVNRNDCGFRKPEYPLIIRPINGLFRPKRTVLGTELAGEVEEVGNSVSEFKIGDKVFGLSAWKFGTHAQYICIPENGSITHMPTNFAYQEAAAVSDGAYLALNLLRKINFNPNPKILINGASGSIGSAAVQLAKHFGANITAVCGTKNLELVKSLGAHDVIDYTKEDFTKSEKQYDVVLDAVGKSSFFKCGKILKPRGIYFSTELGYLAQNIYLPLFTSVFGGRKVMFPIPKDSKADIILIKELMEAGHYKPVIDRIYPMEEIVEAATYVETGQKTGNVVITIGHEH
jgi:NADPH:quinone reductase-like Zn-dependent oxidoreductase